MSKTNAEFNTAKRLIDLERQFHVETLRKRGLSQREIQIALAKPEIGCINQATGEPWSLGLINKDIKTLERLWMRECAQQRDRHIARAFARLDEIYKRAWEIGDLERALKAVQQQRELLGTDAPKQIKGEFTGKDGAPLVPIALNVQFVEPVPAAD